MSPPTCEIRSLPPRLQEHQEVPSGLRNSQRATALNRWDPTIDEGLQTGTLSFGIAFHKPSEVPHALRLQN